MAGAAGYGALLRLRAPRRLALVSLPADFADWLDYTAVVALLVFAWGEGPLALALFALALTLPYVAIGPVLAMLVDRAPLRAVLVLSNLGRACATLALVFAGETAVVLVLVFLRSAVDSAFTPARQAAIQATTPTDLLAAANGLHQAINQTSKIAGPALGGLLLLAIPAQAIFGINAALSLVAALLATGVEIPDRPTRIDGPASLWANLTAGISEFGRNRLLLTALVFSATAYFAIFLYDALLALLAVDFGLDATWFGVGVAVSGLGGIAGALLAGRLDTSRPLHSMSCAAIVAGTVTGLVGLSAMLGIALPGIVFLMAFGIGGGSVSFMLVPYRTIIQRQTPPDRIARVFAAGEAVITAVMMSAPFLGALIAGLFGTGVAFLVGGVMLVALAAVTLARSAALRKT